MVFFLQLKHLTFCRKTPKIHCRMIVLVSMMNLNKYIHCTNDKSKVPCDKSEVPCDFCNFDFCHFNVNSFYCLKLPNVVVNKEFVKHIYQGTPVCGGK